MSKLSKLLVIGSGVAVANFYTKNPKKVDEHASFIKKKAKDYYGYTRCMIRYTKKNGVEEAVNYMYNDFKNVVKRTKNSLENTYENAVDYGKELSNNVAEIKEHAADVKSYSKEFKENITTARAAGDELKPVINNYKDQVQSTLSAIKYQVANIKKNVEDDKVQEKVEKFKNETTEKLNSVNEKLKTEVLNKEKAEDKEENKTEE
mgnify:FL=1